jgi:hypothetical protein
MLLFTDWIISCYSLVGCDFLIVGRYLWAFLKRVKKKLKCAVVQVVRPIGGVEV